MLTGFAQQKAQRQVQASPGSQQPHEPRREPGSGLGVLADALKGQDSFPYADIPGFPQSTGKHGSKIGRSIFSGCVLMMSPRSSRSRRPAGFRGAEGEDVRVHAGSIPHV